jgi:hypothetical protein
MKGFYINLVLTTAICFGGLAAANCCAEVITEVWIGSVECEAGIQICNYHTGQTCPTGETCAFPKNPDRNGTTVVWHCKCR